MLTRSFQSVVLLSLKQALLHSSCLPPPSMLSFFFTHCRVPNTYRILVAVYQNGWYCIKFFFYFICIARSQIQDLTGAGKVVYIKVHSQSPKCLLCHADWKKTQQIHKYSTNHQILGDQLQNQYEQKQKSINRFSNKNRKHQNSLKFFSIY